MAKKKTAIPGIKRYFEPKAGKWYAYHRASGRRIGAIYGTPEFIAEVARINEEIAQASRPKAGTLGALITQYRATSFEQLSDRTRIDYQRVFDYLKPMAQIPLEEFTSGAVVRIRDKAFAKHKRRFANYVVAVLSIVFEFARERELLEVNPVLRKVKKIRRPKKMADANRPWEADERAAVLAAAPIGLKVPIALAMFMGLREGDALVIERERYRGTEISIVTSKAGTFVWWRCPAALRAILEHAPKSKTHPHLALNSRGLPWTPSGFRASWRKLRIDLEEKKLIRPGLTIHGLRHTVATILREEGFDTRTIADALGQKTEGMAQHYSKGADLRKKMEGVADAIDRAYKNETKLRVV